MVIKIAVKEEKKKQEEGATEVEGKKLVMKMGDRRCGCSSDVGNGG